MPWQLLGTPATARIVMLAMTAPVKIKSHTMAFIR
jgi:hypothetical protein